ncbi:hypothetical protein PV328_000772 [Microctonus aethiopoides]|uniref:Uncharacterized protein n=1 Tax=Microctonus aethiopoides TaxID=144406 RepID=A0AA39FVJ9_9HYME|nr:hypothetical protein PV328_000772 [Microctonus aethiopoides]
MRPTLLLLLALFLIAGCKSAEEEYDYDDEPAPPPVTPAPTRPAGRLGSLLSPRGRNPVGRKPSPTTSTTPKPVEQSVDEAINESEEFVDDNQEQVEISSTTTEATKKLRAGGVRPFRSNEDLLAALKRRRAQVNTHTKESTTTTTHSPAESTAPKSKSSGSRSRIGANESSSKSSNRGRFGGNNKSKVGQEEVEETQQDEVQLKPKPYRRG